MISLFRHPGLELGSTFLLEAVERKGGPRIKSGVTD